MNRLKDNPQEISPEIPLRAEAGYPGLRRDFLMVTLLFVTISFGIYILFRWHWAPDKALRWLIPCGIVALVEIGILGDSLRMNRRKPEDTLLPNLGYATWLTLLRGILIAILAGFAVTGRPPGMIIWVPGVAYLLASLLDILDGYVARRTNRITILGKSLDMKFDALGTFIATMVGIHLGALPLWYMLVGLAYYLFEIGAYLRKRTGRRVYPLDAYMARRVIAGYQMGFLSVALLPVFPVEALHVAAWAFFAPTLLVFLRDWAILTGRVDPFSSSFVNLDNKFHTVLSGVVLPGLRIVAPAALITLFIVQPIPFSEIPGGSVPLTIGVSIMVLMTIAGLFGRFSALILAMLLGMSFPDLPQEVLSASILLGLLIIVIFGTGKYSLWQEDEDVIYRRHNS